MTGMSPFRGEIIEVLFGLVGFSVWQRTCRLAHTYARGTYNGPINGFSY